MRRKLQEHFGKKDVDEVTGNYILQINVGSNAGPEVNRIAEGLFKLIIFSKGVVSARYGGHDGGHGQ